MFLYANRDNKQIFRFGTLLSFASNMYAFWMLFSYSIHTACTGRAILICTTLQSMVRPAPRHRCLHFCVSVRFRYIMPWHIEEFIMHAHNILHSFGRSFFFCCCCCWWCYCCCFRCAMQCNELFYDYQQRAMTAPQYINHALLLPVRSFFLPLSLFSPPFFSLTPAHWIYFHMKFSKHFAFCCYSFRSIHFTHSSVVIYHIHTNKIFQFNLARDHLESCARFFLLLLLAVFFHSCVHWVLVGWITSFRNANIHTYLYIN